MKGWELAHSIAEKIHAANVSKDGLEVVLGNILGMLTDGTAGNLSYMLRQPSGIDNFVVEMKETMEGVSIDFLPVLKHEDSQVF